MMRRYLAIARLNSQLAFVNRLGLLLRVAGAMMGLAVGYYVWRTVFAQQGRVGPFDWPQIKTYLLFAAFFTILVSGESEVAYRISYGYIAVDLTRPLRLGLVRMAESAGQAVTELVMALLLWVLAATIVGGLAMPSTPLGWALLLLSLVWAVLLKASIVHTWILVCFWTYNAYGVERLRYAVTAVLSGGIVPIALFPSWLRHTAQFLPFQGIVVTPAEVAIGRGGASWALAAIAVQAAWVAVLGLLATWLWRRGLRRVAIQGG
jgi:ABC-2 type transport system permease protein